VDASRGLQPCRARTSSGPIDEGHDCLDEKGDIPVLLDPDRTPALEAAHTPCKGRLMTCNRTANMFLPVSTIPFLPYTFDRRRIFCKTPSLRSSQGDPYATIVLAKQDGHVRICFKVFCTDCSSLNCSPECIMSMMALGRMASRSLRNIRACPLYAVISAITLSAMSSPQTTSDLPRLSDSKRQQESNGSHGRTVRRVYALGGEIC
jgi:hypothetical protein